MQKLIQAGAIPFRHKAGTWEFLLVTSQRGNWIFPKGIVEPEMDPTETAAKECQEEAGVHGTVLPELIGTYNDHKWKRDCQVLMYLIRYESDAEPWEESSIRERRWCTFEEAKLRLKKAELRQLLEKARETLEQEPDQGGEE